MVKDLAVMHEKGRWYVYASERWEPSKTEDRKAVWSPDLVAWQGVESTRGEEFNSPDITRQSDGTYVMTHQRTVANGLAMVDRIVISTARSLDGPWSQAREIGEELFPGQRLIDGAIASTQQGLFLIAKRGDRSLVPQIAEMFHSPSGDVQGPWQHLGSADIGWTENFQFISIDGTWHLLATTIPVHRPALFKMTGDQTSPSAWLRWTKVGDLEVPAEQWNSPSEGPDTNPGFGFERANSAYLVDERGTDGFFYLFYAGSTELATHDGRGLARIGVARSRDLRTWFAAGEAE